MSLFRKIISISKPPVQLALPYIDQDGNTIRLWSHSKLGVFGVVVAQDEKMQVVTTIKNGLNPKETGLELSKRMRIGTLIEWDLIYHKPSHCITIFPKLRASMRDTFEFNGTTYNAKKTHIRDHDISANQTEEKTIQLYDKDRQTFYPSSMGELTVDKIQILAEFSVEKEPMKLQDNGRSNFAVQVDTSTLSADDYAARQTSEGVSYQDILPYDVLTSMNGMGQTIIIDERQDRFITSFPNPDHHSESYKEDYKYNLPEKAMGIENVDIEQPDGSYGRMCRGLHKVIAMPDYYQELDETPPAILGPEIYEEISQKAAMQKQFQLHEESCMRIRNFNSQELTLASITFKNDVEGVELLAGFIPNLELYSKMHFLAPVEPGVPSISLPEIHRLIKELFIGIYIFNQAPSFSLDNNYDDSVTVSIPPAYAGTFIEEIMRDIDYNGKAIQVASFMPQEARLKFNPIWKSLFAADTGATDAEKFLANGGINLFKDQVYGPIARKFRTIENKFGSLDHLVKTSSFVFQSKVNSLKQFEDIVLIDTEFFVSGQLITVPESKENFSSLQKLQKKQNALYSYQQELVKLIPEIAKKVELLKLLNFLMQFLISAKRENLMPNLSLLNPLTTQFIHEADMPPLIIKCTSCSDAHGLFGGTTPLRLDIPEHPFPEDLRQKSQDIRSLSCSLLCLY